MLPSCQVSFGQSGCSQMYTTFSALNAVIVSRILRKRKEKHRKICGETWAKLRVVILSFGL